MTSSTSHTVPPAQDAAERIRVEYSRVSGEKQDIARQEGNLVQLRAILPSDLSELPVVAIEDDGVSAFKHSIFDRPGGRQLIAVIESGTVAVVCVDDQDRLSRGRQSEWWLFHDICRRNGTRIFTANGGEITDDIGGETMAALRAAMARQESATKSHRVKTKLAQLREDGYWPGGPPPLGYYRGEDRILYETDDDAPLIREAFERFDRGQSKRQIRSWFNSQLEDNSAELSYILRNATYAGYIPEGVSQSHGRERERLHEGRHGPKYGRQPIVPRDLFDRVQAKLDEYAAADARLSKVNPFWGIAFCGSCGNVLRFKTIRRSGNTDHTYYECENAACDFKRVVAEYFDFSLLVALAGTGLTLRKRLDDPTWAVTTHNDATIRQAEADLNAVSERVRTFAQLIGEGTLAEEDAAGQLDPLYTQKRQLEAALRRLAQPRDALRASLGQLRASLEALHPDAFDMDGEMGAAFLWWMQATTDQRRDFFASIIDRIELHQPERWGFVPGPGCIFDQRSAALLVSFKAGIQVPVPLKFGHRDKEIAPVLRSILGSCRSTGLVT